MKFLLAKTVLDFSMALFMFLFQKKFIAHYSAVSLFQCLKEMKFFQIIGVISAVRKLFINYLQMLEYF